MEAEQLECISRFFREDWSKDTSRLISNDTSKESSQSSLDSETDSISLSQLTIEEREPINVKPFFNITPRKMPLSPHYILEEEFSSNPWAMLIATIFLTKTSAKIARPHMKSFFQMYPTPYHVLDSNPTVLEKFFDTLGLRKRAQMIWKLSYQFVSSKWRRASDLCGIGKYGEDAYRICCLGHTDVDPNDRYLKLYLDWLRSQTEFLQNNGVTDCECVLEDPVTKYYRITLRYFE